MAFQDKKNNLTDVREIPKNIEAEQVVLGAAILEPDRCLPLLVGELQSDMFYERRHRAIFACMVDLFTQDEPCDIVLLANRLEEKGDMEKAGGRMYLNDLLDNTTTTASLEYYRDIVKRKAILRSIISIGGLISEAGYDEEAELQEVIDRAEAYMFSVAQEGYGDDSTVKLSEYLPIRIQKISELHTDQENAGVTGIRTGIHELDLLTGGLQESDLVVVAGRPSTGKSSLVTTVTANSSISCGAKTAIFSLEMNKDQVTDRILTTVGLINLHHMRSGRLTLEGFREVTAAASKLVGSTVFINDTPGISVLEIRSRARRLAMENDGLDIVIVDYIQLVEPGTKFNTREQEVGFVSRSLKKLARELNCTLIACSQLNRESTKREDKRPRLDELRDSGSIEQDADIVVFIHRPGFTGEEDQNNDSVVTEVELIVAKQRNGPTGIVEAIFHKSQSAFQNSTFSKTAPKKDWNVE